MGDQEIMEHQGKKLNHSICFCFLIVLLLNSFRLHAQLNVHQPGFVRQKKITSFQQIFDLKKGVLFVMLYSKRNKIDALRSMKRDKEADDVVKNQSKKNKEIIQAFRNNFDYCPVYFFSNIEVEKLLQGKIDSIHFLNDSLVPDDSIRPGSEIYFVAEFGMMSQGISTESDPVNPATRTPVDYYSGAFTGKVALMIEDSKFMPLKKPFPYYVIVIEDEDRIFMVDDVVAKLNERLYSFNRTAKRRILKPKFTKYFDENN